MPTVQDILDQKGTKVLTIPPSATVADAVHKMNQNRIGSLVVMDDGRVVGMFTERDVLTRVVGAERRPSEILVGEVMTDDVFCCTADSDVDEIGAVMKERRVRHVPVCDGAGGLLGLVSIGDLNGWYASAQQAQITFLNEYIYGRV